MLPIDLILWEVCHPATKTICDNNFPLFVSQIHTFYEENFIRLQVYGLKTENIYLYIKQKSKSREKIIIEYSYIAVKWVINFDEIWIVVEPFCGCENIVFLQHLKNWIDYMSFEGS